jgi:hypothetical protein
MDSSRPFVDHAGAFTAAGGELLEVLCPRPKLSTEFGKIDEQR